MDVGNMKKPFTRIHRIRYKFTPKFVPTILVVLLLPLLIFLGFWQLNRADEKRIILTNLKNRSVQKPLNLEALNQSPQKIEYYPVKLLGNYDNRHQFFLDNKVIHQQVGFEVITPFQPKHSEKILLVDRGFIVGGKRRDELPKLPPINDTQMMSGIIKEFPKKSFVLQNSQANSEWPKVIQNLEFKMFEQSLQKPIYPFLVYLSPEDKHGFIRQWQFVSISVEKHLGYAFQWFSLAATLVIIYLIFNITKEGNERPKDEDTI